MTLYEVPGSGPAAMALSGRSAVTPVPHYSPDARMAGGSLRGEVQGKPLSRRQLQCLVRAAQGWTDVAIGIDLGISRHSVQNHFTVAYAKLGVQTRIEAFIALGWLKPPAVRRVA